MVCYLLRGIVGFSDVNKTIQNTELMARIMDYASDIGVLIMQHAEDYELSKNACINDGEIATRLGLGRCFVDSRKNNYRKRS